LPPECVPFRFVIQHAGGVRQGQFNAFPRFDTWVLRIKIFLSQSNMVPKILVRYDVVPSAQVCCRFSFGQVARLQTVLLKYRFRPQMISGVQDRIVACLPQFDAILVPRTVRVDASFLALGNSGCGAGCKTQSSERTGRKKW
jgi:hypothetical protein